MKCDVCKGSGIMPMPQKHAETLAIVERDPDTTATAVQARIGVGQGATYDRLYWLEARGFVKRREVKGINGIFWSACEQPKTPLSDAVADQLVAMLPELQKLTNGQRKAPVRELLRGLVVKARAEMAAEFHKANDALGMDGLINLCEAAEQAEAAL